MSVERSVASGLRMAGRLLARFIGQTTDIDAEEGTGGGSGKGAGRAA